MVAFDLNTGDEKWRWNGDGPSYASPLVATFTGTRTVVALTDARLIGFRPSDGTVLWETPFAGAGANNANRITPIIDGPNIILTGPGKGVVAVKVDKEGDKFVVANLWSNLDNSVRWSNPVQKNGLIFGFSERGSYFSITQSTGKTAWVTPAAGGQGFGSVLEAGNVILTLSQNGQLRALAPNEKSYEELANYKVAETDVFADPVISGQRIYIKDRSSVSLWTIE